jgi:hypothetical protein
MALDLLGLGDALLLLLTKKRIEHRRKSDTLEPGSPSTRDGYSE